MPGKTDPPGSCAEAHREQGNDLKQPAQLHQGQVLPGQPSGFLWWSDKRRATDTINRDFCKAFDTVPHHILLCKLETDGFDGWPAWWMRN